MNYSWFTIYNLQRVVCFESLWRPGLTSRPVDRLTDPQSCHRSPVGNRNEQSEETNFKYKNLFSLYKYIIYFKQSDCASDAASNNDSNLKIYRIYAKTIFEQSFEYLVRQAESRPRAGRENAPFEVLSSKFSFRVAFEKLLFPEKWSPPFGTASGLPFK